MNRNKKATSKQVVGNGRVEGKEKDIESEDEVDPFEGDDARDEQEVSQLMGEGVSARGEDQGSNEEEGSDEEECSDEDEGSDEEDGSDKDEGSGEEDGSDEEDGSNEDRANPDDAESSDEDNDEKKNDTLAAPTTPLAAAGSKRSRTGSGDNIRFSKRGAGSVKSGEKDDPSSFQLLQVPNPGKPLKYSSPSSPFVPIPLNSSEEHIRNAERIDHLNTSARLCSQTIRTLHATGLNYKMQRTVVESQLDAILATTDALESHSTALVDALTQAQIDQFKTSTQEFLKVLLAHRPIDFRVTRVQANLDKISAKLHK